MNKKLYSAISLVLAMVSASALSSCIEHDENESESLLQGYFTVEGSPTKVVLHQDGGGTVIPDLSSINKVADFVNHDRYMLQLKYRKMDISADGKTITGAQLFGGQVVPVSNPLTIQQASDSSKLVLAPDSLFSMRQLSGYWAYRGYLTIVVNGDYSYKITEGRTNYIYPSLSLVYDPAQLKEPNRLDLTLCYNRHTDKQTSSAGTYNFPTSFRLDEFAALVPGNDTIQVSIAGVGITTTRFKVGRQDLLKGNY